MPQTPHRHNPLDQLDGSAPVLLSNEALDLADALLEGHPGSADPSLQRLLAAAVSIVHRDRQGATSSDVVAALDMARKVLATAS